MRGGDIRIVIIGLLTTAMLLWGCPPWLHGEGWRIAFAHHFFHAGVLHLAVNCWSVWAVFRKDARYGFDEIIVPFACATLSWFASSKDPVGASNFLFALLGYRTPSLKSGWWRKAGVRVFLFTTVAMVVIPQVSAVTHIVSFILGCMCAGASRLKERIGHDYTRATR